jgi:DNA polymerase-1
MYKVSNNVNDLKPLLTAIQESSEVGLDIETTGLDPYSSKLLLIQLAIDDDIFIINAIKLEQRVISYIISLIKESDKLVIGHNLSFDLKMLFHATDVLLTNVHDTMITDMIINGGLNFKFPSLGDLVLKYCNIALDKEARESFIDHSGEFTNTQLTYAALDVRYLKDIRGNQFDIIQDQGQHNVYLLENKLVPVFSLMEYDGIYLNTDKWLENSAKEKQTAIERGNILRKYILERIDIKKYSNGLELANALSIPHNTKKLTLELESLSTEFALNWIINNFNINSHAQLKSALSLLGIEVPNTNEDTLQKFKNNEIIGLILDYRESEKRVSTYGEDFLSCINPITNRVHTNWNQLVSTGRISSSNPNLQNQPREESFRSCYEASEGNLLITADYSQAELRLMGALSREPEFITSFINGEDLHKKSASLIYDIPIVQVTKEQRHVGKSLNFGLNYGISKYGLYRKFNIPMDEGERLITKYFSKLPYISGYVNIVGEAVWKNRYSNTPLGRKRFFEDKILFSSSSEEYAYQSRVKREGVNHTIQGGIADVVKIAMLSIFSNNPFGRKLKILMQVHDELVIEVSEDIAEEAKEFIKQEMIKAEQPFLKEIPAVVDVNLGKTWSKD